MSIFLYAPLQLRELQISSTTIISLSYFFRNLTNLQDLNLSQCQKLENLPYSFKSLTKLRYLDLSYCSNLTLSRETIGNICTLEHIDLIDWEHIEFFPSQLVHQRSLETLNLWELKNLIYRLKYLPYSNL